MDDESDLSKQLRSHYQAAAHASAAEIVPRIQRMRREAHRKGDDRIARQAFELERNTLLAGTDEEAAIRVCRQCCMLEPTAFNYMILARALHDAERWSEAVVAYTEALQTTSAQSERTIIERNIARCKGHPSFEGLASAYPNAENPSIQVVIDAVDVCVQLGRPLEARAQLARGLEEWPNDTALRQLQELLGWQ